MALSPAVLRRVAALLDQDTRVSACVGSERLAEALAHPSAWRRTVVHAPTPQALQFVCRVRPEVLHLVDAEVRRAEWFLEQLLEAGAHRGVRGLYVSLAPCGSLAASTLLPTIAEFPALRELTLEFESVSRPACLAFPEGCEGLRDLTYLRVTERPGRAEAPRHLEVYLADAELPALQEVHLRVATSDVLAHVSRFPLLRVVRYGAERESFEDADLEGATLDTLAVDVRDAAAMHFLAVALESAGRVDRVQLTCHSDVCFDASAPLRHLAIRLRAPASELDVAYPAVRRASSVTVEADASLRRYTLRFSGTGSCHNFLEWTQRALLHVSSEGVVVVDPM